MGNTQNKRKAFKQVSQKYEPTASKGHCRKVWTSYGIAVSLFSFISPFEVYMGHHWNKFFYERAIARV